MSTLHYFIKRCIKKLGKNEDAFLPIALMCLANATIKPMITLSNPRQSYQEKHYAAKREFLNEMVALPTCFLFAWLFKKMGTAFVKPVFVHLPLVAKVENLKLLENTVFSSIGIILANFAIPNVANILLNPLEKILIAISRNFLPGCNRQKFTQKNQAYAIQNIKPIVTTANCFSSKFEMNTAMFFCPVEQRTLQSVQPFKLSTPVLSSNRHSNLSYPNFTSFHI